MYAFYLVAVLFCILLWFILSFCYKDKVGAFSKQLFDGAVGDINKEKDRGKQ